eukprot:g13636.t1
MCDINASSKRSGCIGKKGIGWKSTFAVSNCPHVLSGSFTFKFDVAGTLGKLGYVTPTWLSEEELEELPVQVRMAHLNGGTVIYLPLLSGFSSISEAFDQLLQHHVTILFLKRLCRINLEYPDGRTVLIQRDVLSQKDQFDREDFPAMALHVGLPVKSVGLGFAVDAPFELVASRGEFMASSPELSAHATKLLGADVVPRPIWQHLRQKLLDSLTQVACVITESGEVCSPSACVERPTNLVALKASQLVPANLLQSSCGKRFAAESRSGMVEVFSLKHWIQILKFRGGDWPKGLIAEVSAWENPCDFFLPFGAMLELALQEAHQPSEVLREIWDVDLLPAFRSQRPLRISSGQLWARPCLKIRADWQGLLCDANLLHIVEPRVRFGLQTAAPQLLEALSEWTPTRCSLGKRLVQWHLMEVNEKTPIKAVLASLACLRLRQTWQASVQL